MPITDQRRPCLPQNYCPCPCRTRCQLATSDQTSHANHDPLHATVRNSGDSADFSETRIGGETEGQLERYGIGEDPVLEERGEGDVHAEMKDEGRADENIITAVDSPISTSTSTPKSTPTPTPVDTAETSLAPSPRLEPKNTSLRDVIRNEPIDTVSPTLAPSLRLALPDEGHYSSIGTGSSSSTGGISTPIYPPHPDQPSSSLSSSLSLPSPNLTSPKRSLQVRFTEPLHTTTTPVPLTAARHTIYRHECGTFDAFNPPPPSEVVPPLTRHDRVIYQDDEERYYTIVRNGNRKPCWLVDTAEDVYNGVLVWGGWRGREGWEADRREEWRVRRKELRKGKVKVGDVVGLAWMGVRLGVWRAGRFVWTGYIKRVGN